MQRNYGDKMQRSAEDKGPEGRLCGECVHLKRCQDEFEMTASSGACRNFRQGKVSDVDSE